MADETPESDTTDRGEPPVNAAVQAGDETFDAWDGYDQDELREWLVHVLAQAEAKAERRREWNVYVPRVAFYAFLVSIMVGAVVGIVLFA